MTDALVSLLALVVCVWVIYQVRRELAAQQAGLARRSQEVTTVRRLLGPLAWLWPF